MKLSTEENKTQVIGKVTRTEFAVSNMPVAMRVLTQNIYSNPVRTVIREICCNAADAHKQIGLEKPIRVKIPTYESTTFVVEDWGPGISPDDIENIFCNLFASTKRDSNSQTGCFGIGAKSPFAITNTFTVVSTQNHVERHYVATKEGGDYSMILLHTKTSEKESGVTVSIPVKEKLVRKFRTEAFEVLPWFEYPPEPYNRHQPPWPEWETEHVVFNHFKGTHLLMGNVLYPLEGVSWKQISFRTNNFTIKAPVGAVDVTASREALEYTEKTLKWLNEVGLPRANESVKEVLNKKLESVKTEWERELVLQISNPLTHASPKYVNLKKIIPHSTDTGTETVKLVDSYERLTDKKLFFYGEASRKGIRIREYLIENGVDHNDCAYVNKDELPEGAPMIDVASLKLPKSTRKPSKNKKEVKVIKIVNGYSYQRTTVPIDYSGNYLKGITSRIPVGRRDLDCRTVYRLLSQLGIKDVVLSRRNLPKGVNVAEVLLKEAEKINTEIPALIVTTHQQKVVLKSLANKKLIPKDPKLATLVQNIEKSSFLSLTHPGPKNNSRFLDQYRLAWSPVAARNPKATLEYLDWIYER